MPHSLEGVFCFLLPQTTIRTWGIDNFRPTRLFQYEYILRRKFDERVVPTIYELNKMILGVKLPNQNISFIDTELNKRSILIDPYIDCHLLNLDKYYGIKRISRNMKIVDYSSLGHRSLLFSDIRFPKEFLRAFKRNALLKRDFHPCEIYHWDDFASGDLRRPNFGWKNVFVSTEKIRDSARSFLEMYQDYFPELKGLSLDKRVVLILAHNYDGVESVTQRINKILYQDSEAAEKFRKADCLILKQHRTSLVPYPDEFMIFGKKIRVLKSVESRLLPAEILTLGVQNLDLYSASSSVIFSNVATRYRFLETHASKDLKDYGLMYKRNGIQFRGNSKNEPDEIL